MSAGTNLTGSWVGEYLQHDRPHPITAELVQAGESLTGSMRDGETDRASTVSELASDAGLPPGADERIIAQLREMFPGSPAASIRYVSHLPEESALDGWVRGSTVYLLKTYQGAHFDGFKVGDKLVGRQGASHAVHYRGELSPDCVEIEGKWRIDAVTEHGAGRAEGYFTLRRQ